MINQQQAREELSKELLEWQEGKNNILLFLPTGTGKTYSALNIIKNKGLGGGGLVLVPEIALIKNFKDDAIKHGFGLLLEGTDVICYASLNKITNTNYPWIICDEAHRAKSDLRMDSLNTIHAPITIGLSATVNEETEETLMSWKPFDKFILTLNEAIDRGLVPPPEINIITLELDNNHIRNEFTYGKKKVKCTDKGYYQRLSDSISYWKDLYQDEGKEYQKLKMLSQGSMRSRFLGECKTDYLRVLVDSLEGERMIIFCSSVKQANKLGGKLVASSEKTKKDNGNLIDDFNNFKVDKLFVKSMLAEGQNLTNCKYGIITQLNNQEKDAVQRIGRVLRHAEPIVYILVMKDTVDERFLKNSLGKVDESFLTFH